MTGSYFIIIFAVKLSPIGEGTLGFMFIGTVVVRLLQEGRGLLDIFLIDVFFDFKGDVCKFIDSSFNETLFHLLWLYS